MALKNVSGCSATIETDKEGKKDATEYHQ